MHSGRVLLVDDEKPILDILSITLRKDGFTQLETASTGQGAVYKCRETLPDIVVLDIMLPDMDGLEVCRQIRTFSNVPILFLTAKSTDLDKLMGFGMGGDDYVTKPFNPLEIVARVRAHLRRHQHGGPHPGFVLTGRSLREIEDRERHIKWVIAGIWGTVMAVTLGEFLVWNWLKTRKRRTTA